MKINGWNFKEIYLAMSVSIVCTGPLAKYLINCWTNLNETFLKQLLDVQLKGIHIWT